MIDVKGLTRAAVFGSFADAALATLTVPDEAPIQVHAIGVDQVLIEAGVDVRIGEGRHVIALRRDEAPTLPTGTTIEMQGQTWTVDSIADDDGSVVVVVVH